MNEQLKTLANRRKLIEGTKLQIKSFQESIEKDPKYQFLQGIKNELKDYVAETDLLEDSIKATELAAYLATKEKPTLKGIIFKMNHKLEYVLEDAIAWSRENAKVLFKFDQKEFEKMASKLEVPGVKLIDVPTIQLASDLSEYLAE